MSGENRRGLLGRLAAGLGWLSANGEPTATQALAMLLEDPLLRDALLRRAEQITGADLHAVRWFQAELVQDDLGRPDLAGIDDMRRPLLVVEAKFGASLTAGQVHSYLDHQERRVGPAQTTAMLVLVPTSRTAEAERVLAEVHAKRLGQGLDPYPTKTGVITWDEWLSVWDDAVAHLPATPASLAGDLYQLRELCLTLGGLVVAPFGDIASSADWRAREKDFNRVFDQLTTRLKPSGSRTPVTVHEPGYDPLRYFPGGYADSACSIGIASRFADSGSTPLWLRYHKVTPGFREIRDRLMSSDYATLVRSDESHLWLPLDIPADRPGPELVEHLVEQVNAIRAVVGSPNWG